MGEHFDGEKLQFFILELPRLQKIWDSLEENVERWCYIFENLHKFVRLPMNAQGFETVFEIAQTGCLQNKGLVNYLNSMVTDYEKLTIGEYAHQEGLQEGLREGLREGKEQMAEALRALGVDEDIIRSAMEYPLQKK
jgi:hypothetical protein